MNQEARIPFKVSLVQDDFIQNIVSSQGGYIQSFIPDADKTFIEITIPYFSSETYEVSVFSSADIEKEIPRLKEIAFCNEFSESYEHEVFLMADPKEGSMVSPKQKALYVAILDYTYSYCAVHQIAIVKQKEHWFLRNDVVAECVMYRERKSRKNSIWVHWDGLSQHKLLRNFLTKNTNAFTRSYRIEDENDITDLHEQAPLVFLTKKLAVPDHRDNDEFWKYCFVEKWDILRGEGIVCDIASEERYAVSWKMIRTRNIKPYFICLETGTIVQVVLSQERVNIAERVYHYGYPVQENALIGTKMPRNGMIPIKE